MLHVRKQRYLSNGPNLLGLMLFAVGMLAFCSLFFVEESAFSKTIWVGLGACFIGFILMNISSGIALDIKMRRYRHYDSILGFTSGQWETLPQIEKMEMVQHSYISQNTPNGISPTFSSKLLIHKVVLISSEKVELSLDFSSEKAAVKAMQRIQELMK
jgi:hypothetical protein